MPIAPFAYPLFVESSERCNPLARFFARAGHLAVWLGFYVTAAVVFVASSMGLDLRSLDPLIFPFAFLTASTVYLVDRIKLTNAQLDPADQQAHPDRYAYLTNHPGRIRIVAAVLSLGAMSIGSLIHPLAPVLVLLSVGGVVAYAFPSARLMKLMGKKRLKDLFLVKNIIVSVSITVFAAGLMAMAEPQPDLIKVVLQIHHHPFPLVFACLFVSIIVLGDAILCDIEDMVPDRTFSTSTVPVRFGTTTAWITAIGLNAVAFGLAAAWPAESALRTIRLYWAILLIVTTLILATWKPHRIRDLVDIRLALVTITVIFMSS